VTTRPRAAEPAGTLGSDQSVDRPLRYRGRRLDGPAWEFHAAVDALQADTVPFTYYAKVLAARDDQAAAER
jgi:hypothetical protein